MRRLTIELPDGYDEVLAITAIGHEQGGTTTVVTNVHTGAFDLSKNDCQTLVFNREKKAFEIRDDFPIRAEVSE